MLVKHVLITLFSFLFYHQYTNDKIQFLKVSFWAINESKYKFELICIHFRTCFNSIIMKKYLYINMYFCMVIFIISILFFSIIYLLVCIR